MLVQAGLVRAGLGTVAHAALGVGCEPLHAFRHAKVLCPSDTEHYFLVGVMRETMGSSHETASC